MDSLSRAGVIMVQEHRLNAPRLANVMVTLRKAGWRYSDGPCPITDNGRASAGALALFKHYLNYWAPDTGVRGRLARCFVRLENLGETMFVRR
eukprot:2878020-Pyramimonas_sp.AAC.1